MLTIEEFKAYVRDAINSEIPGVSETADLVWGVDWQLQSAENGVLKYKVISEGQSCPLAQVYLKNWGDLEVEFLPEDYDDLGEPFELASMYVSSFLDEKGFSPLFISAFDDPDFDYSNYKDSEYDMQIIEFAKELRAELWPEMED